MDKLIIISFLLILSLVANANSKNYYFNNDSTKKELSSLRNIVNESKLVINDLDNRLIQSNSIIENQSVLINSFGVIYTILTIVFTIIGFFAPLAIYFFGIKPSKEQINKLELNFDLKLKEYLKASRANEIDTALNRLTDESIELRQNAITFLSLTQYEGFTDQQYFKIYKVLSDKNIDSSLKLSLSYVLTGKKNEFATEYCKLILYSESVLNDYIPARYFGMIGVMPYLHFFVDYLKNVTDKNNTFLRLISHMKTVSLDSTLILFESSEIIELFTDEDLVFFAGIGFLNLFEAGVEQEKLINTSLYKRIFIK